MRWDYLARYPEATTHLRQLAKEGASARALIPVFPSNTFPNHYSIVTGLYPAHHGIIDNEMFDPDLGEFFRYTTVKSARDNRWWGGEPIWITAVKQGQISACYYWPGSEAEIGGHRPTYWKPYNYYDVTFESRLDELVGWLKRPVGERPNITTFYFEETNAAGHNFGPDSPDLAQVLKQLDARIGAMQARFRQEGISANLVIVSDHGMTPVSAERTLILEDFIDLKTIQLESYGSIVSLRPVSGDLEPIARAAEKIPHAKTYRAEDLPARFRLRDNARIPPLWVLPDEGWRIVTKASQARVRPTGPLRGDHGYDPAYPSMHGILIVHGPSFRSDGRTIAAVENIHVYHLLCAALGLQPAANDGDRRLVRALLR